jgi:NAD(P)-dependent dehydrogenase (short-subunit alcohol dehydrogenase family)
VKDLRDGNVILTGASRGLGIHLARALAREGVNLALAARSSDALREIRDEMVSLGVEAVGIPVNNAGVQLSAPYSAPSGARGSPGPTLRRVDG